MEQAGNNEGSVTESACLNMLDGYSLVQARVRSTLTLTYYVGLWLVTQSERGGKIASVSLGGW